MEKEKGINKMGVMSIKKLLITMGIPMMVSMALQAVYNSRCYFCITDEGYASN